MLVPVVKAVARTQKVMPLGLLGVADEGRDGLRGRWRVCPQQPGGQQPGGQQDRRHAAAREPNHAVCERHHSAQGNFLPGCCTIHDIVSFPYGDAIGG